MFFFRYIHYRLHVGHVVSITIKVIHECRLSYKGKGMIYSALVKYCFILTGRYQPTPRSCVLVYIFLNLEIFQIHLTKYHLKHSEYKSAFFFLKTSNVFPIKTVLSYSYHPFCCFHSKKLFVVVDTGGCLSNINHSTTDASCGSFPFFHNTCQRPRRWTKCLSFMCLCIQC